MNIIEAMGHDSRVNLFVNLVRGKMPEDAINWVIMRSGFIDAPASTRFHGAYEGGLLEHSWNVAANLARLTDQIGIEWQRRESPWIVGMMHDLCKHDNYKKMTDEHGNVFFNYAEPEDKGHGDKSVKLLKDIMELTEEEQLCIRYHMGAFEGQAAWNDYNNAIKKYPAVLWTHTADMIASQIDGV